MATLLEILRLARHFQNDCGGMKNEESPNFDWTMYQDLADMVDILDRHNGNDDCFDKVVLIVPNFNY